METSPEKPAMPEECKRKLESLLQRTFGNGCLIRSDQASIMYPIYTGYFCPINRTIREIAENSGIDIRHLRYIRCAIHYGGCNVRGWISRDIRIDTGHIKSYYQSHDKKMLLIYVTVNGKQEYMILHNATGMPPYAVKKHFYSNPEEYTEVLLDEKVPVKLMRYSHFRTKDD